MSTPTDDPTTDVLSAAAATDIVRSLVGRMFMAYINLDNETKYQQNLTDILGG